MKPQRPKGASGQAPESLSLDSINGMADGDSRDSDSNAFDHSDVRTEPEKPRETGRLSHHRGTVGTTWRGGIERGRVPVPDADEPILIGLPGRFSFDRLCSVYSDLSALLMNGVTSSMGNGTMVVLFCIPTSLTVWR